MKTPLNAKTKSAQRRKKRCRVRAASLTGVHGGSRGSKTFGFKEKAAKKKERSASPTKTREDVYIRPKTRKRRERERERGAAEGLKMKGRGASATGASARTGARPAYPRSPKIINLRARPGKIIKRVPWLRRRKTGEKKKEERVEKGQGRIEGGRGREKRQRRKTKRITVS